MMLKNIENSYGLVAKLFHWLVGLMIIIMLIVGFTMVNMEDSAQKWQIYPLHKATGMAVLFLVSLRLLWRLINVSVLQLNDLPQWQKKAANLNINLLYIFMFIMPLSGFLMSTLSGRDIDIYGLFKIPFFMQDKALANIFNNIHDYSAFILVALIILHIMVSIYHHFIRKDNVFRRMWFGSKDSRAAK